MYTFNSIGSILISVYNPRRRDGTMSVITLSASGDYLYGTLSTGQRSPCRQEENTNHDPPRSIFNTLARTLRAHFSQETTITTKRYHHIFFCMFLHLSLRSTGVRVESKVPDPNSSIFLQGRFLFSLSENLLTPSCKHKIYTWKW